MELAAFQELMDETDWPSYGTGNYEKCADCMVHCGYEASAVNDTVKRPFKALKVALKGVRTDGPMAPEIPLHKQRSAEFVFDRMVAGAVAEIHAANESAEGAEDGGSVAAE